MLVGQISYNGILIAIIACNAINVKEIDKKLVCKSTKNTQRFLCI